jgi:hypothetical protein
MTAYKPRSLSSGETAILTPVAGAPHSDEFKITTLPNLSGWKPYMGIPTGRNGRLDVLNRKLDQGQLTVPVQDQRLTAGGSNLTRWVTAFLGSLSGTPQMLGIKVLVEESLDGGSTWANYFTGRISALQLQGSRIITGLVIRDLSSELNTEVFVGRAHSSITYVVYPSALPVGLASAFGTMAPVTPLPGTFGTSTISRVITVTAAGIGRADNFLTTALIPAFGGSINPVMPGLRVRFTTAGVSNKEAELVGVGWGVQGTTPVALRLYLAPVSSTSDPYYQDIATGTIANGTACTFTVLQRALNAPGGQQGSSLMLSDVHPVQLWADLLDGKFSRLKTDGSASRTFPRNSSAFSTMIADGSFPLCRFVIPEPAKLQDWVEKNILHPFGLGCYLNEAGEVVPVDLRPPQSSPTSTTITNADLSDDEAPQWSIDREAAISVVRVPTYRDRPLTVADLKKQGQLPDVPPGLLDGNVTAEYQFPFFSEATLGTADFGERTHVVEARGLRGFADEFVGGHSRDEWIQGRASEIAAFFRPLFGSGPQYLTLTCRRTSNTNGVQPGTWRLIDVDEVPGLSSYVRGENRLMLCVEATPKGSRRVLRFLDAGPNTVATQPTVATPAQEASNTQHGITVAVTLNGGSEEAVLWINPTSTGVGTRPADSDAGWRQVIPAGQSRPWLATSTIYTVRNLPSDKRIWVRVRTDPVLGKKLASAWAYPSGTGYVATAAMTAPTALAAGTVTTKAAILTWTVGDPDRKVVVRKFGAESEGSANAGTPVDFVDLPPGTSRLQVDGLDSGGPWWHFDVYHKDDWGGESSKNNLAAFQATGTAATAPKPGGLVILRSQATNPTPPPANGLVAYGKPGIQLGIIPSPFAIGLDVELYRAPDSGGSPGTYALLVTIPGLQIGGTFYTYSDYKAQDNATYWYKCRHIGNSVTAGAYTADVSAIPGWLVPEVYTVPSQPILGEVDTLILTGADFQGEASSGGTGWQFNGRKVSPLSTAGAVTVYAGLPSRLLPVGSTISQIRARVTAQSGDALTVGFRYGVDNTGTTVETLTASSTGDHTMSLSGASVGHVIAAGRSYAIDVLMDANATATDVGIYRVEIDFVRNSYRQ